MVVDIADESKMIPILVGKHRLIQSRADSDGGRWAMHVVVGEVGITVTAVVQCHFSEFI